jgi:hypothetical protein
MCGTVLQAGFAASLAKEIAERLLGEWATAFTSDEGKVSSVKNA